MRLKLVSHSTPLLTHSEYLVVRETPNKSDVKIMIGHEISDLVEEYEWRGDDFENTVQVFEIIK